MCPLLLDGAGKDRAIIEVHSELACSVAFPRLAVMLHFQLLTALRSGLICIKRREMEMGNISQGSEIKHLFVCCLYKGLFLIHCIKWHL